MKLIWIMEYFIDFIIKNNHTTIYDTIFKLKNLFQQRGIVVEINSLKYYNRRSLTASAASSWHSRHALVTSGPALKGPVMCSEWSSAAHAAISAPNPRVRRASCITRRREVRRTEAAMASLSHGMMLRRSMTSTSPSPRSAMAAAAFRQ